MDNATGLTYDKLLKLVEQYPPRPFVAFTFSPSAYHSMMAVVRKDERKTDPLMLGRPLDGVEAWNVLGQTQDCIQWNDKEALRLYLGWMGETGNGVNRS